MEALFGEEEGSYFKSFAYISSGYLAMQHSSWVNHCRGCLGKDSEQFYENFRVGSITPTTWKGRTEGKLNSPLMLFELEGNAVPTNKKRPINSLCNHSTAHMQTS